METKKCAYRFCYNDPRPDSKYCAKCKARIWREQNPLRATYLQLKCNAKRRDIYFGITIEEWEIWCGVYGYLELRGIDADSMTVDRDDPNLGYIYSNMVMRTKSDNSKKAQRDRKRKRYTYEKQEGDPF